jgi:hypothetical protein
LGLSSWQLLACQAGGQIVRRHDFAFVQRQQLLKLFAFNTIYGADQLRPEL